MPVAAKRAEIRTYIRNDASPFEVECISHALDVFEKCGQEALYIFVCDACAKKSEFAPPKRHADGDWWHPYKAKGMTHTSRCCNASALRNLRSNN